MLRLTKLATRFGLAAGLALSAPTPALAGGMLFATLSMALFFTAEHNTTLYFIAMSAIFWSMPAPMSFVTPTSMSLRQMSYTSNQ